MKFKEYALYKGDELLAIGTRTELAKKFDIKEKTISFYNSPAYKKRIKGLNRRIVVICLD